MVAVLLLIISRFVRAGRRWQAPLTIGHTIGTQTHATQPDRAPAPTMGCSPPPSEVDPSAPTRVDVPAATILLAGRARRARRDPNPAPTRHPGTTLLRSCQRSGCDDQASAAWRDTRTTERDTPYEYGATACTGAGHHADRGCRGDRVPVVAISLATLTARRRTLMRRVPTAADPPTIVDGCWSGSGGPELAQSTCDLNRCDQFVRTRCGGRH
jgi:hypothetical protein